MLCGEVALSMPSSFSGQRGQTSYRIPRKGAFLILLFTTLLRDWTLSLASLSVADIAPLLLQKRHSALLLATAEVPSK